MEQGYEVFAALGNINYKQSRGCDQLGQYKGGCLRS